MDGPTGLQWEVIAFLNVVLGFGLILMIVGVLGYYFPHPLDQLNYWFDWVGAGLTIFGTCFVAASVWIPPHAHPPAPASELHAVIAIVLAVAGAVWMIWIGQVVNTVVLGFAILGLAGSAVRILPFAG